MSMSYNYPPEYAFPSAPPLYRAFPPPPRLHWGWVFGLSLITFGLFGNIWMLVQSLWVKKVTQNSKPFGWSLAYLLVMPATFLLVIIGAIVAAMPGSGTAGNAFVGTTLLVTRLATIVCYIGAAFTLKSELEAQPIDIPLSGVMTFFFAPYYFQYHLYDYSVEGKVGEQLSGFAEPAVAPVAELPPQV